MGIYENVKHKVKKSKHRIFILALFLMNSCQCAKYFCLSFEHSNKMDFWPPAFTHWQLFIKNKIYLWEKSKGKDRMITEKEVSIPGRNTEASCIIFQVIENVTSCSLSSLSCTSFFTKSATNNTQAIISMIGKTKEMASRYLGNTEKSAVRQISRKPNIQSLSTTADEKTYHSLPVWQRDRDAEGGRAILKEGFGDFLTARFWSSYYLRKINASPFYSLFFFTLIISGSLTRRNLARCFSYSTAIFHSYHVRKCVAE